MIPFHRKLFFGPEDLAVLQRVFDLACADLKLSPRDRILRERLGAQLFALAQQTSCLPTRLRKRVVLHFCATVRRVEVPRTAVSVPSAGPCGPQKERILAFRGGD